MIAGYGVGDEHINYWLREFIGIHGEKARVVEITRSQDPNRFAIQRFGVYDLNWQKVTEDAFVNRAGVYCLTLTGGLIEGRQFDTELVKAQLSGTLRY
jgi:hypothetical protein